MLSKTCFMGSPQVEIPFMSQYVKCQCKFIYRKLATRGKLDF